jgi:hypothetical protein
LHAPGHESNMRTQIRKSRRTAARSEPTRQRFRTRSPVQAM